MSEKIANWLIGQKAISSDERELYAYAVHCLFSLIYPIAFAFVLGIIFGMVMEAIVMIIPFMIIRKFSGGYHADSFGKCLIISSIVIAGALLIGKNIYNGVTLNALYIVASILLIIFSPIDSINKRLDDDDKMFCKKITIVIVLVIFVITEIIFVISAAIIVILKAKTMFIIKDEANVNKFNLKKEFCGIGFIMFMVYIVAQLSRQKSEIFIMN